MIFNNQPFSLSLYLVDYLRPRTAVKMSEKGVDKAMKTYKAICTITWKFDSDESFAECLKNAKAQLDGILEANPHGEDFEGFCVQVDIARMKERKKLVHIGEFEFDEVFPYITDQELKKEYKVKGESYWVRMNSDRYFVFKNNPDCVSCGLKGTKFMLDINPGDQSPHFNLYGEENGRLVLMTKDHIRAKSQGGTDDLANYQTMCSTCNNLKGHYDLSLDQVAELRTICDNGQKLPRKELRDLINTTREQMSQRNLIRRENGSQTEDSGTDQSAQSKPKASEPTCAGSC